MVVDGGEGQCEWERNSGLPRGRATIGASISVTPTLGAPTDPQATITPPMVAHAPIPGAPTAINANSHPHCGMVLRAFDVIIP